MVSVLESVHVAATGVTYKKGQKVEVSDELAKKYDGTHFKIVKPDTDPKPDKLK